MKVVGAGIDLESVERFRARPFRAHTKFYRRVFSAGEIQYCRKFKDPASHFAARFCAKEALVKAVGGGKKLLVTEVEVKNQAGGAPILRPRVRNERVRRFFAGHTIYLSLTHTDDQAAAFVVLVGRKGKS